MRFSFLLFVTLLQALNIISVHAQLTLDWHGSIKGLGGDHVNAIAKDNNNHFYISSRITSTPQDIDPGPAVYNISAPTFTGYISKHDSMGNVLDAFVGIGGQTLFVDDSGYLYMCGIFTNCTDFDPGPGVVQLCDGSNYSSGFYAKYSPTGALVFVREISSGPANVAVTIWDAEFSSSGNCVMSIQCHSNLYLDSNIIISTPTPGSGDGYILEIDTSGSNISENLIDCTQLGAIYLPSSVKYDIYGNFLLGGFIGGPGTVIGNATQNYTTTTVGGLVIKLAPTGECIFGAEFGTGGNVEISDIAPLSDSRTAFLGVFDVPFDADPGPGIHTMTPNGTGNAFYGVLDSLGNLIYVEQISGFNMSVGWMISDSLDNIYIQGYLADVYPNPQTGLPAISALKFTDDFIARFDQNGKYSFLLPIEGDSIHTIWQNMMLIDQNHLLNVSSFLGTCDFDLGLGINTDTVIGLMDVGVTKYSIRDSPQNQSSYYRISGTVFHDANQNGIKDPGEIPIPRQVVEIQPGNLFTMTDANGFYMKYGAAGNYTIKLPAFGLTFNGTCVPAQNTAVLSSQIIHDTGNDFGIFTTETDHELEVVITPVTPFLSNFPSNIQTTGRNNFLTNNATEVKLKFDSLLNVIATTPSATILSNSEITWQSPGIPPFSSLSYLTTFMDTAIFSPDSVTFSAIIESVANDFDPMNNYDTLKIPVDGSMDPNMKIVTPSGDITTTQIVNGLILDYTIYFQNTGLSPAWRVIVIDTLSANLNLSTLEIVDVSHPSYNVSLEQGNVLVFQFNNINLPDSATDEPGSHGFVRYRVKPISSLSVGTLIENNAGIIFDFNQPVITNTTSNLVVDPLSVSDIANNTAPEIYPTITSDYVFIKTGFLKDRNNQLSIYDVTGAPIVLNKVLKPNEQQIYQFINEAAGIYFLTVTSDRVIYRYRVVFIK